VASPCLGQDATSAVYHDNVVVVVDASGSMSDTWKGTRNRKMDVAKQAMKTVLSQVSDKTQIGIVQFGPGADWIYPLRLLNHETITQAIDNIETGGGTPLGSYIKKGADALILQRQKQFGYGSYRLLIVTDGAASGLGEESKVLKYTPEVIARGITVDVIGVDMGKEHSLAQIVGNNYRAADDPASLTKAITEVFAEVNKQDASDAATSFELLEGLDPSLAKEMIGALAKPQNHPIGDKPRLKSSPMSSALPNPDTESGGIKLLGGAIIVGVIIVVIGIGRQIL